ncbi:hypothetical protein HJC23_002503 [Cyclotella cryptica]|uniref:DRBM domain-containing protein n=1 Tax=Cyclotella cryptica TaxID=29204 RepID=A0ABD3QWY3_9STRA
MNLQHQQMIEQQHQLMYPFNMQLPYYPHHPHHPHPPPFESTQTSTFQPHHPLQFPNFLPPPALYPTIPNSSLPLPQSANNLDATRQYYEMQMREHAMQYANAAANAAFVAARIAYGDHPPHHGVGYPGMIGGPPSAMPSHYIPAAAVPVGMHPSWPENHDPVPESTAEAGSNSSQRHHRALWKPPNAKSTVRKADLKRDSSDYSAASSEKDVDTTGAVLQKKLGGSKATHEKKRSKKREMGGNDSVSSLGSGSRDRSIGTSNGGDGIETRKDECRLHQQHQRHRHNNQRQKRGLYQSYSPRESSSSLGTLGSNSNSAPGAQHHAGRHKRRNTESLPSPRCVGGGSSVFLGGLIGKSGVSALHELCSKYRWEMPKYELVEPSKDFSSNDKSGEDADGCSPKNSRGSHHQSHNRDFVLSVRVNGVELGRGRGGTKAQAKQDASRKALAALVPGVVFDPNGILLDVGSGLLRIIDENSRSVPTSLEELTPHLASQLAIGGAKLSSNQAATGQRTRPSSPDFSEDSSISTAVSMTKTKIDGENVILGGILHSSSGGVLTTNSTFGIHPSASSTSEVDDDDDNAYYETRGARVCSTLLHAMWQIDCRIREPPSYMFDLLQSNSTGGGNSMSKDTTDETSTHLEITAHRLPFQCTASLKLYFPKRLVEGKDVSSIMDYWESPLEHLQTKPSAESCLRKDDTPREPSRKRKDSFTSQATPSPVRHTLHQEGDSDEFQSTSAAQDTEELVTHHLESTGTGSTKRESKHRASAKMLAMLFPECSTMIEVKAAAECARQCYAAKKVLAQTKRAKLSNERSIPCEKSTFSPAMATATKKLEQSDRQDKGILSQHTLDKKSNTYTSDEGSHELEGLSEGFVSVAGLSLSEPTNECKRIKWSKAVGDREVFGKELNTTLKLLHREATGEEEGGSLLLRLAKLDDFECTCALLDKSSTTNSTSRTTMEQKYCESIDVAYDDHINSPKTTNSRDSIFSVDQQGSLIKMLLLTRAAIEDDPPLGVALVSFANEIKGRSLSVHVLKHEESIPRERFIDCLDELANAMNCSLQMRCIAQDELSNIISFVYDNMSEPLSSEKTSESYEDSEDHPLTSSHLQSVKEEDSEDGDGSEEDEGNDLAGRKRSRVD